MYDNQWVLRMLQNNVCKVTFTKVDGSNRVMRCTLLDDYLPEQYKGKGQLLTEGQLSTIAVWDLESGGWRSFRVDSLSSVTVDSNGTTVEPSSRQILT